MAINSLRAWPGREAGQLWQGVAAHRYEAGGAHGEGVDGLGGGECLLRGLGGGEDGRLSFGLRCELEAGLSDDAEDAE